MSGEKKMLKTKFLVAFLVVLTIIATCIIAGCGKKGKDSTGNNDGNSVSIQDKSSDSSDDNSSDTDEPKEHINVPVDKTELNIKTISIKAGETFDLADYPIKLPVTDCNYFLAEMLIDAWPCNLTIKVTDTEDEDNYFILKAKIKLRKNRSENKHIFWSSQKSLLLFSFKHQ